MMKLFGCGIAFALLSSGCVSKPLLIPDPAIPHEIAEEAKLTVWCGTPDRKLAKCQVRALEGWWVAGPEALR